MPVVQEIISAERIARRVEELADEIAHSPEGREGGPVLVLAVLKGAFMFAGDLVRALDRAGLAPQIDFLTLSSYGDGTVSSGTIRVASTPRAPLEGRHVLLVDDILDSGRSLAYARDFVASAGAASVRTCVLLDKPSRRVVDVAADHVGFEIEDRFVVGYGVDFAEQFRHLPFIGVVED